MTRVTPAEYYATHPDYRARLADGTPSMLRLDETGATVLEPVRFTEDLTRCGDCGEESPNDPCDFCGIESSEAEHEANNALLARGSEG